jgi:NitT/TauT family transport system ATP-binding protein
MSLKKSFDEKIIFDNFSYSFPSTGVFALFGESGIGKTTLLRLIAGLDKNYDGTIEFEGISKVAFAFQEYRLFPTLTALENVFYANFDKKNEADLKKCQKALAELGFGESDMSLYPKELSGGMKQRVSLARAFLNDAPVLLLDEPTKELDEENVKRVIERISEEGKHRLVILVTHEFSDIEAVGAEIISLSRESKI